jgi:hypothetical protein
VYSPCLNSGQPAVPRRDPLLATCPVFGVHFISRGKGAYNDFLIDFAFNERAQDYEWFLQQPYWAKWLSEDNRSGIVIEEPEEKIEEEGATPLLLPEAYGIDDVLEEGVFVPRDELEQMVRLLRTKKVIAHPG